MTERALKVEEKQADALAGFDGLSLYLEKLLDECIQARKQQELEWLEDYQDAMAIPRDDDTRGTGAPRANKSKQLFIGSTRSKIRTAKARIRDTLFGAGKLPFDTTPNKEELRDFADCFETIVENQLLDMEYKATLTAGINSITTYGTGWTFGPFVRKATIPDFTVDNSIPGMPQIRKSDFEYDEPYYQHGRTMDVWPDPEANTEQTGRGVFWVEPTSPADLQTWRFDENYRNVDAALAEYGRYLQDSGSYLAEQARGNVERFSKDKRVNLVRFFGRVPESLISEWESGETQTNESGSYDEEVEVVVIMAGGIAVNAKRSPYRKYRPSRRCVYEEAVEPEMYGVGIPRNNRPHQRVTNGAFRLYMEGKGMALLGMWNIDRSKFSPREDFKLFPGKVFERAEGVTPEEAEKAMIQYKMDDVTGGWERVIELSEKFSDDDTGITKYTQGQDSSNLNKTATGVSMIMNASSVPLKDVMANIDSMWIEHHINDLIEWDLEFLEPQVVEKIHGPEMAQKWAAIKQLGTANFMNWRPTGQSTFVSREILAQKLQGFLQIIGSNEKFQSETDTRELLEQIWDAMDIGKESPILSDEDLQNQKGAPQVPPEIQEQMIKAKEEFDKLAQAHQEMQKQNDQLQMQLKSKDQEIQIKSAEISLKHKTQSQQFQMDMQQRTQEFMLSLASEERAAQREDMLKKYIADMTTQTQLAVAQIKADTDASKAVIAEDTKRQVAEMQSIVALHTAIQPDQDEDNAE